MTGAELFEHQTVAGLAAVAGATPAVTAPQGVVQGPVAWTPIQHWFWATTPVAPHHFNQAVVVTPRVALAPAALATAVAAVVAHHDGLRLQVGPEGGRLAAAVPAGAVLTWAAGPVTALTATARQVQASFDLAQGPLFRVVAWPGDAAGPGRLLLVAHHLVIDGVSWRVLLEDLETAYRQAAAGAAVRLPAKTTPGGAWAAAVAAWAATPAVAATRAYWEAAGTAAPAWAAPPTVAEAGGTVTQSLSAAATAALLYDVPAVYRTTSTRCC